MVDLVQFVVPGTPVAKGRARSFLRAGHIAHCTPEKTARYENLVKLAAQTAMAARSPIEDAVLLGVVAYMPIPASWSQKKKDAAVREEIKPTIRPDLDNIIKALKDGMNAVVWKDDSQVVEIHAAKRYSDTPRVQICVKRIGV